jgi:hypothetical protein
LDLPGHDDGDQRAQKFYADTAGRLRVLLAAYLLTAAGLAFVGFTWLAARRSAHELNEARVIATMLATAAGLLFAAAGASQGPTYAASVDAFDEPLSPITRFDVHEAYGLMLAAYCFAGAALAVLCRTTEALPRPFVVAGYLVAVLSFAAIFYMPLVLLPLWAIAAGAWLLARGRGN